MSGAGERVLVVAFVSPQVVEVTGQAAPCQGLRAARIPESLVACGRLVAR